MKKLIASILFTVVFLASTAAAQTNPTHITGGKFFITGNSQEDSENARIETANFTAVSNLGGFFSPWWAICNDPDCRPGRSFTVITYPAVDIGGCAGDCNQFIRGTFAVNGTIYQNAYYRGRFNFSQVVFQIPKIARRKGLMTFRKPFTMDGHLQVCQISDINQPCPADKILFNGDVKGGGTLTVTGQFRVYDNGTGGIPFFLRRSFEYQFEP